MTRSVDRELLFIAPDCQVVYDDAVLTSPWNRGSTGRLPAGRDWSTFRFAVKDVILGVVTHRVNRQTRRLEVRAWFVGEHPAFGALEPTRALMVVILCQAWQQLGRLEVVFEYGLPHDIRVLVEERLGIRLRGHITEFPEDIARRLYMLLAGLPEKLLQDLPKSVAVEKVCYAIYRGIWGATQIRSLVSRGVPLTWVFATRPDPVAESLRHAHLLFHLRAVLLEEYVLSRLAARRLGDGAARRIRRVGSDDDGYYASETDVILPELGELSAFEGDSFVELSANVPFEILPVLAHTEALIPTWIETRWLNVSPARIAKQIIAVPLDFVYLPEQTRKRCVALVNARTAGLVVAGVTMAQLLSEAEMKLAVTSSMSNDEDLVDWNEDRYAD
jgi:hypothetical protein